MKCLYCELPVYCKHLCRRHYKKQNALKNGTYKKLYEKNKANPEYMEKKRMWDNLYREKKKKGLLKSREKPQSLINQDWKEYYRKWRVKNVTYRKLVAVKRSNKYYEYKLKAIEHYSDGKNCCLWCGNADLRVLDLDHINDDGFSHRKLLHGTTAPYWAKMNNYPPGLQVLCRNCNWLKELNRRNDVFEKTNLDE